MAPFWGLNTKKRKRLPDYESRCYASETNKLSFLGGAIKEGKRNQSYLDKGLSEPLMRHDPTDLGSKIRIRIIPKEHTLSSLILLAMSK